jgi:hypothetical protein
MLHMTILLHEEKPELRSITWEYKINQIINNADLILLCMSAKSKSGDIYREIGFIDPWERAKDESGKNFLIIPVRLDEFVPDTILQMWRWLDYFTDSGPEKLIDSLKNVAHSLGFINTPSPSLINGQIFSGTVVQKAPDHQKYDFIQFFMPSSGYSYWITRLLVNCFQIDQFLHSPDYTNPVYWQRYSKYDASCEYIGSWKDEELKWVNLFWIRELGCQYDIRVLFYFPNLALSSSTTLSSNFLNSGPG